MLKEINAALLRHNRRQAAAIRKELTDMSNARYAVRLWLICVAAPCLAILAIAAAASIAGATPAPGHEVRVTCFDKAAWGPAPQSERPCTTLVAPDNDVVRVIQGSPEKEQSECTISTSAIGNAHCYRIASNRAFAGMGYTADNPHGTRAACSAALHLCAATTGPAEDGSVTVYVYAAGHRIERCTLGNPLEEAGHYSAPCVR